MTNDEIASCGLDPQWNHREIETLDAMRERQAAEKREVLRVALEAAWEEPGLLPVMSPQRHSAAALYRLTFGRGIEV